MLGYMKELDEENGNSGHNYISLHKSIKLKFPLN